MPRLGGLFSQTDSIGTEHNEHRTETKAIKPKCNQFKLGSRRLLDRVGFNSEATIRNGLHSTSAPHKIGFIAIVTHREQMQIFPIHPSNAHNGSPGSQFLVISDRVPKQQLHTLQRTAILQTDLSHIAASSTTKG